MKCPSCGSTDIRLSKHRRRASAVLRLFGYRRYRCRTCWQSFWHISVAPGPKGAAETKRPSANSRFLRRRRRLLIIEGVLFLVMLVIFVVAIRYFVSRRADGRGASAGRLAATLRDGGPAAQTAQPAGNAGQTV